MQRLPKDSEKYLKMLAPYDGELFAIKRRFQQMNYDDIFKESMLIRDLYKLEVLSGSSQDFDCTAYHNPLLNPDVVIVEGKDDSLNIAGGYVTFPSTIDLTSYGRNYFSDSRNECLRWFIQTVVASIMSGFFAWVFIKILGA